MNQSPLAPDIQAALTKLHDIRLPDPVGWWPMATGWWILITLALAGATFFLWREVGRRRTADYLALRELDVIRTRIKTTPDPRPFAVELAVLLRRVALNLKDRNAVIAISGNDWAHLLSDGPSGISTPVAQLLVNAPYAPLNDIAVPAGDTSMLLGATDEVERWIRSQS